MGFTSGRPARSPLYYSLKSSERIYHEQFGSVSKVALPVSSKELLSDSAEGTLGLELSEHIVLVAGSPVPNVVLVVT